MYYLFIYHGLSLTVLVNNISVADQMLSATVTSAGKKIEDKNNRATGFKNPFSKLRARKEILLCEDGAKEQTPSVSVWLFFHLLHS